MSHDAAEQSLAARIRSLGFAPDLTAVLAELAERTEEPPPAAQPESTHDTEYQQMLDRARGPLRGAQHAKPRPEYLRLVPPLAAFAAVAVAVARWATRSAAHQAITAVLAGAVVGAASVPVGISLTPDTAPAVAPVAARHVHRHDDDRRMANVPAVAPPEKRRRRPYGHRPDRDDYPSASASPAPSPSPTSAATPSPSTSPTSQATPAPSPTSSHPPPGVGRGGPPSGVTRHNMLQHGKEPRYGVTPWQR